MSIQRTSCQMPLNQKLYVEDFLFSIVVGSLEISASGSRKSSCEPLLVFVANVWVCMSSNLLPKNFRPDSELSKSKHTRFLLGCSKTIARSKRSFRQRS